jgi:hypothetical protein
MVPPPYFAKLKSCVYLFKYSNQFALLQMQLSKYSLQYSYHTLTYIYQCKLYILIYIGHFSLISMSGIVDIDSI